MVEGYHQSELTDETDRPATSQPIGYTEHRRYVQQSYPHQYTETPYHAKQVDVSHYERRQHSPGRTRQLAEELETKFQFPKEFDQMPTLPERLPDPRELLDFSDFHHTF